MTRVHLICGSTGAGKTTYSMALAKERQAIRYSIDEWMMHFFGTDRPEDASFAWYMDRINRCEPWIWQEASKHLGRGVEVILDLGFSQREHRQRFRERIERAGFTHWLHYLDIDQELRWQRVQHRNREQGATFQLKIDRGMFDFVEARFEPPLAEELEAAP